MIPYRTLTRLAGHPRQKYASQFFFIKRKLTMPRGARAWTRDAVSMELDGAWWFEFRETPPLNAPKYYEYAHNVLPNTPVTLPDTPAPGPERAEARRFVPPHRKKKTLCHASPASAGHLSRSLSLPAHAAAPAPVRRSLAWQWCSKCSFHSSGSSVCCSSPG